MIGDSLKGKLAGVLSACLSRLYFSNFDGFDVLAGASFDSEWQSEHLG